MVSLKKVLKRTLREIISQSEFGRAYRRLGIFQQLQVCQLVSHEQAAFSMGELLEKYMIGAVLQIKSIQGLKEVLLSAEEIRDLYELLRGGPQHNEDLGQVLQAVSLNEFFAELDKYTQGDPSYQSRHRIYVIFDDTLLDKQGKKMAHIHRLFDHCKGAYVLGFHGLVMYVVIGPEATEEFVLDHDVPFYPEHRPKGYRNPNDRYGLAGAFLKFLHEQASQRQVSLQEVIVLFDRWYFGRRMTEICQALEMTYVTQSKSPFVYYVRGERFTASELVEWALEHDKIQEHHIGRSCYRYYTVLAQSPTFGMVRLVVWYRQDSRAKTERRKCKVLVCNNLTTRFNAIKIIRAYRMRWRVEVMFRTAKQLCRLGQFHQTDEVAICNSLSVAYLTFNIFAVAWRTYGRRKGFRTIGQMANHLKYSLLAAALTL